MGLTVDPGLVALFGSEDRVRTLAVLANAGTPLTAYRVATVVGIKPANVYRELKRLIQFNEVERAPTSDGKQGWRLVDADVRAIMRRRLRVVWSEDLLRGARERGKRAALAVRRSSRAPLDLAAFGPGNPPSSAAVRRRLDKDRVLAKNGGRTSARTRRTKT